jgi:hypothetical protein
MVPVPDSRLSDHERSAESCQASSVVVGLLLLIDEK